MAAADDWPARKARDDAKAKAAREGLERARARIRRLAVPPISVDEFIRERRQEALREQ